MPADPHDVLRSDPDLGPLVEAHGPLAVEPADDLFERVVVSVVSQQVSTDAATAIRERLFDAVTVTPAGVLAADPAVLREAGCSAAKARYLRNVARAFRGRGWDHAYFADLDDEIVVDELTAVTGVGTWTAKMFLVFCLGREDVFPVEDLGIRRGMERVVDPDLDRDGMVAHAERWRPYRSYAARYLWRAVD